MLTKICSLCKSDLPIDKFNKSKSHNDGFHTMCRVCRRIRERERLLEQIKPIEDLLNEIWSPVDIIEEGYLISNLGRIKSLSRKFRWNDTILKHSIGKRGYPIINIGGKHLYIHRLIAIYFIPNPLKLPEVNHLDGNKLNYAISNLKWSTGQDNIIHAHKNGLMKSKKGEENPSAKLTEKQVSKIRQSKLILSILSNRYNVSKALISKIKTKQVWKHLS